MKSKTIKAKAKAKAKVKKAIKEKLDIIEPIEIVEETGVTIIINKFSTAIDRGTRKFVICRRCNIMEVEIDNKAVHGTCHVCMVTSCAAPKVVERKVPCTDIEILHKRKLQRDRQKLNDDLRLTKRFKEKKRVTKRG